VCLLPRIVTALIPVPPAPSVCLPHPCRPGPTAPRLGELGKKGCFNLHHTLFFLIDHSSRKGLSVWLAPLVVNMPDGRVQHHAERRDGVPHTPSSSPRLRLRTFVSMNTTFCPLHLAPSRNKPAVAGPRSATSRAPRTPPSDFKPPAFRMTQLTGPALGERGRTGIRGRRRWSLT
jgi:hypothetical protein